MDTFRKMLGYAPAAPPPPPPEDKTAGDIVYPMHMLDDTKTLRGIIVTWTLRFNDVLDPDKLHSSLSRLLEMGDWRKVGGRVRLNGKGELEVHVPEHFTEDRPAFTYTHTRHDMIIEKHPLGKTLPKSTTPDVPSLHPGPGDFREFAASETAPKTLQDLLGKDIPQLSLHITSFTNATLVALAWPHTLMDVMGQEALLRAWSLALAGRTADVPPLLGANEDVIASTVDKSPVRPEEFLAGKKRLAGWAMGQFGMRFAWDMIWYPIVESNTLYLPKKPLEQIRAQAEKDLGIIQWKNGQVPFVSDGDLLTAWMSSAVSSSLPQPRPITVLHPLNVRFRLPAVKESKGVYVQNMALAAFSFLSADTATSSLGLIAMENRKHIMQQSTQGQIFAFIRQLQPGPARPAVDPATVVCGETDSLLMPFTNWSRADFFNTIDFRGAVIRAGETKLGRKNKPGTIVYHHSQAMVHSPTMRNVVVVLGKDHDEGYWLTGHLMPQTWVRIREQIETLS